MTPAAGPVDTRWLAQAARLAAARAAGRAAGLTPTLVRDAEDLDDAAAGRQAARIPLRIAVCGAAAPAAGLLSVLGELLATPAPRGVAGTPAFDAVRVEPTTEPEDSHLLLLAVSEPAAATWPAALGPAERVVLGGPNPPRTVLVVDVGAAEVGRTQGLTGWLGPRVAPLPGLAGTRPPVFVLAAAQALSALPVVYDPDVQPHERQDAAVRWSASGAQALRDRLIAPALAAAPDTVSDLVRRRLLAAFRELRLAGRDQTAARGWPADALGYPAADPRTADPRTAEPRRLGAGRAATAQLWDRAEAFAAVPVAVRAARLLERPRPTSSEA
jgi:hypothetical protein